MRSPKKAAEQDRRMAWKLAEPVARSALAAFSKDGSYAHGWTEEQTVEINLWLEEGQSLPTRTPQRYAPAFELAAKIAAELSAERSRTALEVALALGKDDGFNKNDHVRVQDPHSRHYGKSGLVWFVRSGRVMVSMAEPRNIGGSVSDSFLPEHLEHLEDPVPVNLERAVLLRFMREHADMFDNLTSTQERCTVLLLATRALRQKIVELGGDDPGPA